MTRGKLVILEGTEGAGKTTQIRLLAELLTAAGIECVAVREPGGTPVGDDIREILLHPEQEITDATEALLFMASRAELIAREILPSLVEGRVVLLDRFFLSTYAYQIFGRGLPEAEVRAANRLATSGLVPDITLLIDVPAAEGLSRADARGARDRMEKADDEFHNRVADAFRQFSDAKWQHSHPECGPIKLIDGTGDEKSVHQRIVSALIMALPQPFGSLKS
ncbi:MAG TPA: dTMP kinase [Gemmatimonadaceae bacterium]|jgi:dTMP kinase|nr:dTMP kinase [Gemmatimonadaceae bacterium]